MNKIPVAAAAAAAAHKPAGPAARLASPGRRQPVWGAAGRDGWGTAAAAAGATVVFDSYVVYNN